MGRIVVVVGGFYGSEAKGHVAAQLSKSPYDLLAVRVGGPNAGHTVIDAKGMEWKLRQIPVAAVARRDAKLAIAEGSEIDPEVLAKEIFELDGAGYQVKDRLTIDPSATIIEQGHQLSESGMAGNGWSTGKGIGAARADRVMRSARLWGQPGSIRPYVHAMIRDYLRRGGTVLIEGTQGYGLGMHTTFYPRTTSSDCRAIDFLAMAGVSPWMGAHSIQIWVVLRTRPIRIAGDSGPLQGETTWGDLGLDPEYTTVTNKVRRVGAWDAALAVEAIRANGGPGPNVHVALMHLDYEWPCVKGATDIGSISMEVGQWLVDREREISSVIRMVGTGPATCVLRPSGGWTV